jgi:phage baseplate assembly protein W
MNGEKVMGDIVGTGLHFPLGVDGRGGIGMIRHEKDIEESIRIIVATSKGERRMRPDFGCRVHELVFAPNNATTWGLAAQYVEDALGWWEPRIEVQEVDVRADTSDTSRLMIDVKYIVKATSDERSLVYPFYLSG